MECGLSSYQIRGQSIMFIVQQHYGCAVRIPYTSALPVSIHHKSPTTTTTTTTYYLLLSRFSRVGLCAIPWTAAYQAPPSMGFFRQEHWSGLPFPSPHNTHNLQENKRKKIRKKQYLITARFFHKKKRLKWGCNQRKFLNGSLVR